MAFPVFPIDQSEWDISLLADPAGTAVPAGIIGGIYDGRLFVKNAAGNFKEIGGADVDSRDIFLNRNAPTVGTIIPPEIAVLTDNDLQDTAEVVFDDFIVYYITADGTNWAEAARQDRAGVVNPTLFTGTAAELLVIDAAANVETPTDAQIKLLADSKGTTPGSPFHYFSGFPITIRYATVTDGATGVNVIRRTSIRPEYSGVNDLALPDETTFDVNSEFFWTDDTTFERSRYLVDAANELTKFEGTAGGGTGGGVDLATVNAAIAAAITAEDILSKTEMKAVLDDIPMQKLADGLMTTTEVNTYLAERTTQGI